MRCRAHREVPSKRVRLWLPRLVRMLIRFLEPSTKFLARERWPTEWALQQLPIIFICAIVAWVVIIPVYAGSHPEIAADLLWDQLAPCLCRVLLAAGSPPASTSTGGIWFAVRTLTTACSGRPVVQVRTLRGVSLDRSPYSLSSSVEGGDGEIAMAACCSFCCGSFRSITVLRNSNGARLAITHWYITYAGRVMCGERIYIQKRAGCMQVRTGRMSMACRHDTYERARILFSHPPPSPRAPHVCSCAIR
jgi:hypothetical protein